MASSINIIKGDTWKRAWLFKDSDNQLVDLTGASIELSVKDTTGSVKLSASLLNGKVTLDTGTSTFFMVIPSVDMHTLDQGKYTYSVKATLGDGTVVTVEHNTKLNII